VVFAAFDGKSGSFSGVPVSARGEPLGPIRSLGPVSESLRLVAVRPSQTGFVVVYTEVVKEGESVSALCIDAKGQPQGAPTLIASLSGRAMWLETQPVAGGSLVFYGGLPDESKLVVEIGAVPLDAKCRPGERVWLTRDARAWQITPFGAGAMLALVRPGGGAGGDVEAVTVDASGRPAGALSISRDGTAEADVDAVRVGDSVMLAWTDRRGLEPRLYGATLDAAGKLSAPPHALTPPEGEQALLELVAPGNGGKLAYVAWENLSERRPPGGRIFQLAALDASGALLGARARLEYASLDGLAPELAASRRGLAALTLAPLCRKNERCDGSRVAPTFVELDPNFGLLAAEPLRLDALGGAAAEHGFNLACASGDCLALAALRREPAPVFSVELGARTSAFRAPVERVDPGKTPRVLTLEALASRSSCAAFSIEKAGDQEFLATITDFDPTTPWRRLTKPAPDGRYEPLRAQIALDRLGVGPKGVEPARAAPISLRAHSLGGVTLAPGSPERGDLLVAWAGVDQGVPQIFLTLVAKSGDRLNQHMLTRKKGDLGEIAATWVGDGWIIAWVDERSGDLEVFAAKVDTKLNRVGLEQRITEAPGAAAEPALAYDGSAVRVVWSDARSPDEPGHGDIFSALLGPRDAARIGPELRLATTRAHSFSPSVRAHAGGFAVAWGERGEDANESGTVAFVHVGADRTVSPLRTLGAAGGEPRSVGLDCAGARCRLGVILERANEASLAVATVASETDPATFVPVLSLLGSAGAAVPPVIRGDDVLFVDGDGNAALLRRAKLAW
jgi:hypothetical protein